METLTTTFVLPNWIAEGLASGNYERVGGVVRDHLTKQVVAWLREGGSIPRQGLPLPADPVTGVLNLIVSAVNTGVSVKGFADVKQKLGGIEQTLQQVQGVLQVTSAASVLNLGISVMGFAVISQRLNELEKRLKKAEELLKKIDRKIDLGFYANFKAALGLAVSAFTMSQSTNRRDSALQAINRFLEAEHIYADYTDKELEQKSQIADEYLLTLSLAYLAEARCYLELGEHDIALHRFQQGSFIVRERIQKYVELLLTSNPAAYLQPHLKEQTDLRRLTLQRF